MVRQPQHGPADQKARVLVELSRHWMAWMGPTARGDYEREATSATWDVGGRPTTEGAQQLTDPIMGMTWNWNWNWKGVFRRADVGGRARQCIKGGEAERDIGIGDFRCSAV